MTPPSVKLKSSIRGNKAAAFIQKAEKALTTERIEQCLFTIQKLKIEKEKCEYAFYSNLKQDQEQEPEIVPRVREFISRTYACEYEKCKLRHVWKVKGQNMGQSDGRE